VRPIAAAADGTDARSPTLHEQFASSEAELLRAVERKEAAALAAQAREKGIHGTLEQSHDAEALFGRELARERKAVTILEQVLGRRGVALHELEWRLQAGCVQQSASASASGVLDVGGGESVRVTRDVGSVELTGLLAASSAAVPDLAGKAGDSFAVRTSFTTAGLHGAEVPSGCDSGPCGGALGAEHTGAPGANAPAEDASIRAGADSSLFGSVSGDVAPCVGAGADSSLLGSVGGDVAPSTEAGANSSLLGFVGGDVAPCVGARANSSLLGSVGGEGAVAVAT
jgi:hypothetical protein